MSSKERHLYAITAAIGIALSFTLLELCLRLIFWLNFQSPLPFGIRDENGDRAQVLRLRPNFSGKSRISGIIYQTNSYGFRSDPVVPSADHVLFLGDSTTFGLNLPRDDVYPTVFESLFRKDCGQAARQVQSVNTATPGQGTFEQLKLLQDAIASGSHFHVKAVVLGFFHNDISDNYAFHQLKGNNRSGVHKWLWGQLKHLRTALYLNEVYHMIRAKLTSRSLPLSNIGASGRGPRVHSTQPGREVELDWLTDNEILSNPSFQLTIQAINEVVGVSRTAGIPLVFAYLPSDDVEIITGRSARYKTLLERHLLKMDGVMYLDILKLYRDRLASMGNPPTLPGAFYSIPGDAGHPGKLASRLIAEGVEKALFPALCPKG